MRRAAATLLAGAFAATLLAAPAAACLPPDPDWKPPTEEEKVRWAASYSSDIVYGVVTKGSDDRGRVRFKVLHAYKGDLKPGTVLTLEQGWGLNPPPCIISPAPPVERGAWGVVYFNRSLPRLDFLYDKELELMFRLGLIQRARPPQAPGAEASP